MCFSPFIAAITHTVHQYHQAQLQFQQSQAHISSTDRTTTSGSAGTSNADRLTNLKGPGCWGGCIVGIVVGTMTIVVAIAAVVIVLIFCYLVTRRRDLSRSREDDDPIVNTTSRKRTRTVVFKFPKLLRSTVGYVYNIRGKN